MIPKIIYQTFSSIDLPDPYLSYTSHLRAVHPDWQYRLYNDKDCNYLVNQFFPELAKLYANVPYDIMRADIFRILVVYLYGGFYFDVDMVFHKSLDELIIHKAVFATEIKLSAEDMKFHNHQHSKRIANYGFGSEAGHPFFQYIIRYWLQNAQQLRQVNTEHDVLETTGPGMLTKLFHTFFGDNQKDVHLLDLGKNNCPKCNVNSCQFGDFASHLHMGSWRWKK